MDIHDILKGKVKMIIKTDVERMTINLMNNYNIPRLVAEKMAQKDADRLNELYVQREKEKTAIIMNHQQKEI